jgi:hypothetical protein
MRDLYKLNLRECRCIFKSRGCPSAWHFTATSHDILTERRGIMYVSKNIWCRKG